MTLIRTTIAVAAIAAYSGAATAATLEGVAGAVMVNRGQGFQPVNGPVILKRGDQVMVVGSGRAEVRYPNGCFAPVIAGSVTAVVEESDCKTISSHQTTQATTTNPPAAPGSTPPPGAPGGPPVGTPPGALSPPGPIGAFGALGPGVVVGAAAVAVGVGVAVASKKGPTSP